MPELNAANLTSSEVQEIATELASRLRAALRAAVDLRAESATLLTAFSGPVSIVPHSFVLSALGMDLAKAIRAVQLSTLLVDRVAVELEAVVDELPSLEGIDLDGVAADVAKNCEALSQAGGVAVFPCHPLVARLAHADLLDAA